MSEFCGRQSVSVHTEVAYVENDYYYINGGKEKTKVTLTSLIDKVNEIKPGEFIVQSISRDGSLKGADYEMIDYVSDRCSVPFVYSGGIKSYDEFSVLERNFNLSAAMAASIFHQKLLGTN